MEQFVVISVQITSQFKVLLAKLGELVKLAFIVLT